MDKTPHLPSVLDDLRVNQCNATLQRKRLSDRVNRRGLFADSINRMGLCPVQYVKSPAVAKMENTDRERYFTNWCWARQEQEQFLM